MVGLGRMGGNMAERLRRAGHDVVGYARTAPEAHVHSLPELVAALEPPRVVWTMIPAGEPTEDAINELAELLASGDIVVEGGNSNYRDSIRRGELLGSRDIGFIDAGVSGGVWGLENGYSLMVGGDAKHVAAVQPAFDALAPPKGFAHVGGSGAGHFTKMVHNGIEYGLMESFAEGYELLKASELGIDVPAALGAWREGSVVRSWLLDLLVGALDEDPDLATLRGYAEDSGEGRWTVEEAVRLGVPAPVISPVALPPVRVTAGRVPGYESDRCAAPSLRRTRGKGRVMAERADALVMFGVTGDLAKRALFPALDQLQRQNKLGIPIIGVARSDWDDEELRNYARKSIDEFGPDGLDEGVFAGLASSLSYVRGEYDHDDTYERLRIKLDGAKHPLAYLAVPPSVFEHVIKGLAHAGLSKNGRIIVEKPFGRDLESARFLNKCMLQHFKEEDILRMDHFMGKDSVLDLLVFRFDNLILEPLWNRHYIERVEITLAEDFGVEGRGAFYEEVGALRDVVQNHLMELVMLVAMEPPAASHHGALRDEKVKLLRAMRTFDPKCMVRGQYEGYRQEKGVAPESGVETYVAVESYIDNWRWSGVPFYLRAGKKMATTMTEVLVQFRAPPAPLFRDPSLPPPSPNRFLFRLKPDEGTSLTVQIKEPGERLVSTPVDLEYSYDENREKLEETAYERLIGDAIDGDPALFARSDAIEEAWRIVTPALESPPPVHKYAPGTWGPKEADDLVPGGWHNRIPPSARREDL